MNKIQLGIDAISTTPIRIGFEGENVHTQVTFFWTVLRSKYPDAVASLSIKPPVGDIYPKSVTQDGNKVVWDVTASDTANPGSGEYQLTFTDGEEIIKTYIGNFTVNDSIIGDGEAPDPIQDWVADANAVLGELSEISASVMTLEAGESATVEVTEVGGHKNLAFGIPAGEKGEQGEPGDPAPAEEVIPAVNAYLAEVITNPDSPPLDRTLSSSSAAAPADMVGDLKSALSSEETKATWEEGTYAPQTGGASSAAAYIRCTDWIRFKDGYQNVVCADYQMRIFAYEENGTYVGMYKSDGTFYPSSSSESNTHDFRFYKFPQYKFHVVAKVSTLSEKSKVFFGRYNVARIIGELKDLTTTQKDTVVGAVNSLKAEHEGLATKAELSATNAAVAEINNKIGNIRVDGEQMTISIPNETGETIKDATIRLALHNGYSVGTQDWNEIFSPYFDKYSFDMLRFFDSNDNKLPYDVMCHGNYDFVKDRRLSPSCVLKLSDNSIIQTQDFSVKRSTDSGITWTSIHALRGIAIFVDSNDNIYVENSYQLRRALAPDWQTIETLLDYSTTQSTIRPNSIAEDDAGNIYCGIYQSANLVKAYKMASGGNSFSECFSPGVGQHVHCININHRTTPNEVYIGVDAGSYSLETWCWRSTDSGATWTRLSIPDRATDHGYVYFGDGFALGCGETNLKGGSTIYRSTDVTDPTKCTQIISTLGGMRKIHNPKDNIILAYACAGGTNRIEQYYMSTDNGLSWETIYANDLGAFDPEYAGNGIRYITPYFTPMGDTESQCFGTGFGLAYAVRVYLGGDRYSGIVYVDVGDIPVGGKTITLKTGYVFDESNEANTRKARNEPLFWMKPVGDGKLATSNGEKTVTGGYTTESILDTIRYGGVLGSMLRNTIGGVYSSSTHVDLGDIGLTDNTDCTFFFYINFPTDKTYNEVADSYWLATADDKFRIGYSHNSGGIRVRKSSTALFSVSLNNVALYADGYALVALTIKKENDKVIMKAYAPDDDAIAYAEIDIEDWGDETISSQSWYLGDGSHMPTWGISNIMVYDKCMTAKEVQAVYHGRNYYAGRQVYTNSGE